MGKEKEQIEYWLCEFTRLARIFHNQGSHKTSEYWKGQVMGACKIVDLLKLDIDTKYWLNQLP